MKSPNLKQFLKRVILYLARSDIPVWLGYLGAALIATFPLILRFRTHISGDIESADLLGHFWHYWWLKTALFQGENPYYITQAFYPIGKDLIPHSGGCLNALLTVPFQALFSLSISHNIVILLLIAFTAYGAYRLTGYFTKDRLVAFISGIIFAADPSLFLYITIGRLDRVSTGWIPLFILFLFKTLREERMRNALLAGLFLALATFSYMGYGLFLLIFTLFFIIYYLISERKRFKKALIKRFIILFLTSCILILPLLYPFINYCSQNSSPEMPWKRIFLRESQALPGFLSKIISGSLGPSQPFALACGPLGYKISYLLIFLALLGLFSKKLKPKFWLFSALLFFLLALGPYLKVFGRFQFGSQGIMVPLPYLLFYKFFPFFYRLQHPVQFLSMVWLSLTVLAGWGLKRIFNLWIKKRGQRLLFSGLIIALIFLETLLRSHPLFPIPLSPPLATPNFYHQLAQEEECAIIEVPIAMPGYMIKETAYQLNYQIIHHKKTFSGTFSGWLLPPSYKNFLKQHTLLQGLLSWQEYPSSLDFPPIAPLDLRVLKELGFKYIIVHNDWLEPEAAGAISHYLCQVFGGPKRYPGDNLDVYYIQGKGPAVEKNRGEENIYLRPWRYEELLREYQAKLKSHPSDLETLNNLGLLYMQYGRFSKATAVFEQALNSHPRSTSACFNLGNSYLQQELYGKAGSAFRKILKIDPYCQEAKRELEISRRKRYLSRNPHDVAGRQALAALYRKKEAYNQAIRELGKALAIDPENISLHLALGQNYEAKELLGKAKREYEKALVFLAPAQECLKQLKKHYTVKDKTD